MVQELTAGNVKNDNPDHTKTLCLKHRVFFIIDILNLVFYTARKSSLKPGRLS